VARARQLLQGEAFHEAKPEALAQVPDELAVLEQLIINTLESLRTAAGPLGAHE